MLLPNCPRCGSENVVRYFYRGQLSPRNLKRFKKVERVLIKDCKARMDSPKYGCCNCKKGFGLVSKRALKHETSKLVGIELSWGGFQPGPDLFNIYKLVSGATVWYEDHRDPLVKKARLEISEREWQWLVNMAYGKLFLKDWPTDFWDNLICDGTAWDLDLLFKGGGKKHHFGLVHTPVYFYPLIRIFEKFVGEMNI